MRKRIVTDAFSAPLFHRQFRRVEQWHRGRENADKTFEIRSLEKLVDNTD